LCAVLLLLSAFATAGFAGDDTGVSEAARRAAGKNIRIAGFKGDRAAAISFTFDDCLYDQWTLAVPMLARYGFKGTFFVICKRTSDTEREAARKFTHGKRYLSWEALKGLSDDGHEIGNHSWSHSKLTKVNDERLLHEVDGAYDLITEKMGKPPITFCYPGNSKNDRVRKVVYRKHVNAREKQLTYGFKKFTAEKANRWVNDAIRRGKWIVPMIHGIEEHYAAFDDRRILEEHLKYVKSREAEIWVDTFGNVSLYRVERKAAELTANMSASAAEFTLTCPLDPKIYNYPLTVVIPADGVAEAKAKRANKNLPVKIYKGKILVETIPGPEPVQVQWRLFPKTAPRD